jgi:glycosyltransferase involved in cell wall biosynthesis
MQLKDRPVSWSYGIAVVIPSYKVIQHILDVVGAIGPEVDVIYCVDDACPEGSGDFIACNVSDPRVRVLRHTQNLGVGGAVMTGYRQAVIDGARVIVKIDGDGQMDPALLPAFVTPILRGMADYTKGNRFWDLRQIKQMPLMRRIGNLGLSFMAKASTGYWNIFDPTNGYTAIHADIAARLPLDAISQRYFFETDMLFRLNTLRAVVLDVPMDARYGDEGSNLKESGALIEFSFKHLRNLCKRVFYNYFLRDLPVASIELVLAVGLLAFGVTFGTWRWWLSSHTGHTASIGTVMIPSLALVFGMQLALAFLNYDVASIPRRALHPRLNHRLPSADTR